MNIFSKEVKDLAKDMFTKHIRAQGYGHSFDSMSTNLQLDWFTRAENHTHEVNLIWEADPHNSANY